MIDLVRRGVAGVRRAGRAGAIPLAILIACGAAAPDPPEKEAPPPAEESPQSEVPAVSYRVEVTGVEDAALLELILASSRLQTLRDKPPDTLAGLERRAEDDLGRLQTALRSEGYYASKVGYRLDRSDEPLLILLEVEPGPLYRLAAVDIVYEGESVPPAESRPGPEELGLEIGMAARAPSILAAERNLLTLWGQRGHPLAAVRERKTFVQHEDSTMTLRIALDAGPEVRFGPLAVRGLETVDEDYLRLLIDWQRGEILDRRKIASSRAAILATRLFASLKIELAESPDESGELPVTLTVEEGPQRSIGFGVDYSTDLGFGGEFFWEHRNYFGANEYLRLSLTAAEIEQGADASFRKPLFGRPDQDLLAQLSAANEDTDAFTGQTATSYLGVERDWRELWRIGAGGSLDFDSLDDGETMETTYLVGLPLSARRDSRDDLLNPTRGTSLDLALTPYSGINDRVLFTSSVAAGTAYRALDADGRIILAGRVKVGSLLGADRDEVPANKRLYAGGGGSIRGYEFQKAGPLDSDNDPLGGRSQFEVSAEVRFRLGESFGVVPFVDGGNVFDSVFPDFEEQLRWAAGLGLRYFTAVGPVRLDVAFPLNGRSDVDDTFQFYVSFGQAF